MCQSHNWPRRGHTEPRIKQSVRVELDLAEKDMGRVEAAAWQRPARQRTGKLLFL